MTVTLYKTTRVTEDINLMVNRWLAAGISKANILTGLNTAVTNLTAAPALTHGRTIQDPGPLLNPTQPRIG